jgi:uncharacterized SAM-binding protein YcdF (DUF218 family)
MMFALSKIFWWFAAPGNLILALMTLGAVAPILKRARLARRAIALATLLALAITFLPLRAWVLGPLEDRFPVPDPMPAHVDGVIVLGGSIDPVLSAQRRQPALGASAERLIAMADLAQRFPDAKLVFTGGSAALVDNEAREADVAGQVFAEMGVPKNRLILERESRNTYENAVYSKALVNPQPGEVWLLVTSAYHMPRSVGIFRKVGWPIVPYPVDYGVPPGGGSAPGVFLDGLEGVNWGLREWFGLVFYYLAGRTDALFPGP